MFMKMLESYHAFLLYISIMAMMGVKKTLPSKIAVMIGIDLIGLCYSFYLRL